MFDMRIEPDPTQAKTDNAPKPQPPEDGRKPDAPADGDLFRRMIAQGYLPG